jgi:hypothetical protein
MSAVGADPAGATRTSGCPQAIGEGLRIHLSGLFTCHIKIGDPTPEVGAHPDAVCIRPPVFKRFNDDFDGFRFRDLNRLLGRQHL